MLQRLIFLTVTIFSLAATAKIDVVIDRSPPTQFKVEEFNAGLGLRFNIQGRSEPIEKTLEHTLIQSAKITLVPDATEKIKGKVELLLVSLHFGSLIQTIQVYIPGNPMVWKAHPRAPFLNKETMPVKELLNFGDIYWENLDQLKSKIKLIPPNLTDRRKDNDKYQFTIELGTLKNENDPTSIVKRPWVFFEF